MRMHLVPPATPIIHMLLSRIDGQWQATACAFQPHNMTVTAILKQMRKYAGSSDT